MKDKIIINVASFGRVDSLIKTLESIINQCDLINVALNDHYDKDIPLFLYHPKINIFFTDNSLGDAFKFMDLTKSENAYFFTIDDDLIYPSNYVSETIKKCLEFNNKKVITYHGRSFKSFPISSYYRSANERYACLENVENDVKVQFGGTGVMCFHTSLFKIPIEYFKFPNMADIWIGKYCMENKIDIICLKHPKGYIQYTPQKTTIYDVESKNDFIQTQVVNSIFDKTISLENLKNYSKNNPLVQTPNIPIPQPTPPPHEPVKIIKTLEKTQKQINYEKLNEIFNNNKVGQQTVIRQPQNKPQLNKKLNSSNSKMFAKKKLR